MAIVWIRHWLYVGSVTLLIKFHARTRLGRRIRNFTPKCVQLPLREYHIRSSTLKLRFNAHPSIVFWRESWSNCHVEFSSLVLHTLLTFTTRFKKFKILRVLFLHANWCARGAPAESLCVLPDTNSLLPSAAGPWRHFLLTNALNNNAVITSFATN